MSCKHCSCQSCQDERRELERRFVKVALSISTENRTPEEIQRNLDKELGKEQTSKYDVLYAKTADDRTFSVKFKNQGGKRYSFAYRFALLIAKKNLLAEVKMIMEKQPVVVENIEEDLLDYVVKKY